MITFNALDRGSENSCAIVQKRALDMFMGLELIKIFDVCTALSSNILDL